MKLKIIGRKQEQRMAIYTANPICLLFSVLFCFLIIK